jgi:BASS family bile acid:Na+ symporter
MAVIVKYTVMTSVIFLMLAVGLRTPFSQVRQVVQSRSLLMRGLAANFVVAPVLIYVSMFWLPVAPEVKMGIMLMAAAPIAPMAPLPFVGIAKGDLAYSAGLMVVAAVLSVALTPLIISLSFPSSADGGVAVDPMQIVQTLLTVQLLPMGAGMTLQHFSPTWTKRLLSFVPMVGQVGLLVGVGLLMASQAREMLAIGLLGFLINIAVVILCLAIGHFAVINESGERRRALAVSTAIRNVPLAFVIANASFPGTLVAPVTLVFTTFSMLLSVVYAKIMLRNAPARSPA